MESLTIEASVDFKTRTRTCDIKEEAEKRFPAHLPRVTRMMALAIRIDALVRERTVSDYAEVARLGHVSRARMTQIMNLLHLAPDIQEEILFLPEVSKGRDPFCERLVRNIATKLIWTVQRKMWRVLRESS